MTVHTKICGVRDPEAIYAAIAGGVRYIGFVFFPRSPRNVSPLEAARLSALLPDHVIPVALAVDPDDALVAEINSVAGVSVFQLHGSETPERVAEIKSATGKLVMKAIKVCEATDLDVALSYTGAADMLLFDAKTPPDMPNALPGGNALSFDWKILSGRDWSLPWMLSGGLHHENVVDAIRISGAQAVDVSSGVESEPGLKDPGRISAFLKAVDSVQ
jgi:phosphoribosylanthranilate isomerase